MGFDMIFGYLRNFFLAPHTGFSFQPHGLNRPKRMYHNNVLVLLIRDATFLKGATFLN